MRDLTSPMGIKAKGLLFLAVGIVAALLLLLELPTWRTAALLSLAIWSFCRFYYFAFYVIEKYVDPAQKFSGLLALAAYLFRRRQK